jgi:uncharacterized damage-inducible protein DinB
MMKTTDTLTTLFMHNLWANLCILEACAALTTQQLDSTLTGTYGSIRDTLEHIVISEKAYFSRISAGQRYHHPNDALPMEIPEMIEMMEENGEKLIEWATKVQADETVTVNWDGTPREVPKTIILTQVVNHATEHRAQIMAILTQLDIQPPELDGWTYFDEIDKS